MSKTKTPEQKEALKAYHREWSKRAWQENPEHRARRLEQSRRWKAANKERVREYRAAWYQANRESEIAKVISYDKANLDKKSERDRRYRERHAEKLRARRNSDEYKQWLSAYLKKRYATDVEYRIRCVLRASLFQALTLQGLKKQYSISKLVGCTLQELKMHLEAQFEEGMSWENHGDWHIDHIKPCAAFDLSDSEQQKACFHYSNLRPLWGMENFRKNSFYDGKRYCKRD